MTESNPLSRITIDRLGAKGDGVGNDGIFVAGALPGEEIEGTVVNGRIAKPKIILPSVDRVRPPCPQAKSCGGCSLQHASDDFVAGWKTDQVKNCLASVGISADFRDITTSGVSSRRRAALAGRRVKSGAMVGFHARGSDTMVQIPNCKLLTQDIMNAIPALELMTREFGSRRGELTFHVTDTDTGIDVAVKGGPDLDANGIQSLAKIADGADLARLSWNDDPVATRRIPTVKMGSANTPIPPGAFLQATKEGQDCLTDDVLEIVSGHSEVIDLFAGNGTFSLPAAQNSEVHAVEGDPTLCAALDAGWRYAGGLKPVTTEVRDLFRNPILPEDLVGKTAAIIDPPRAGAQAQVRQIVGSNIGRIAFVSCNPATFARDAKILVDGGFSLDWVRPVDQFRWSTHVELVASFSRGQGINQK